MPFASTSVCEKAAPPAALALMSDNIVPLRMFLASFVLLSQSWRSQLELEKSVYRPFMRNAWDFSSSLLSQLLLGKVMYFKGNNVFYVGY